MTNLTCHKPGALRGCGHRSHRQNLNVLGGLRDFQMCAAGAHRDRCMKIGLDVRRDPRDEVHDHRVNPKCEVHGHRGFHMKDVMDDQFLRLREASSRDLGLLDHRSFHESCGHPLLNRIC